MTHQETYEELKELARTMGFAIRVEMGEFDGGLCTIRDQQVILVNRRHPLNRRIRLLAQSLHTIGLADVYVKPALRNIIEDEVAALAGGGFDE